MTFAHVVKGKGLTYDWIVESIYQDLQSLGYPEIRIRADNEPAINALLGRVKDLRDHRGSGATHVEDAVEGQPRTNCVAEKGVQDLTTQCRKYKIAFISEFSNLGRDRTDRKEIFFSSLLFGPSRPVSS